MCRTKGLSRFCTSLSALFLVGLGAHAASAQPFQVGQWQGHAFFAKDSNAFARCIIRGKRQSGVTIEFGITSAYNLEIWLSHKDWRLTKGERYPVSLRIDEGPPHPSPATVATGTLLPLTF
jgi:hypothetical protein